MFLPFILEYHSFVCFKSVNSHFSISKHHIKTPPLPKPTFMKRHFTQSFIALLLLLLSTPICSNEINIDGITFKVDTLSRMKVGPGSFYTSLKFSTATKLLHTFILEVDATSPYIGFESVQGKDSLITCETTSGMAERKSKDGAVYFGGTNADFFVTQGDVGYPIHGCIVEGQIGRTPNNTPHFSISENQPLIDYMAHEGSFAKYGEHSLQINDVNVDRRENQLILYNSLRGKSTRTNPYGTELLLQLPSDIQWNVNTVIKAKVVRKEANIGKMAIPEGCAVLSGHGLGADFLSGINENDEIELFVGLRFVNLGGAPTVRAMVGGDRLILQDNEVTDNDWAEQHPRTAVGYSSDNKKVYFCVVDGRGVSAGVRTKELGYILKSAGAATALNLDGGGSSAMYIKELGVVNTPSDGKERPVCNGIYAVNKAPEDFVVTDIKASVYSVKLPRYGTYTPLFFGYNKYGTLIDTKVKGATLSCDPSLGYVISDSIFVVTGTEAGVLMADYNGIKTSIHIQVQSDVKVSLRLDSVLIDQSHPYTIEVMGKIGETTMPILPGALHWEVENKDVCSEQSGVLRGLSNGVTKVRGTLGDTTLVLPVRVEIPESRVMSMDSFVSFESSDLKGISQIKNLQFTQKALPTSIDYTYISGGRSPFVQWNKEISFYSLPTSIGLRINTGSAPISQAILSLRSHTNKSYTPIQYGPIAVNEDYLIEVDMSEFLSESSDHAHYPIHMGSLKLILDAAKHQNNEQYSISIKEFLVGYGDILFSIPELSFFSCYDIYPNPVADHCTLVIKEGAGSSPLLIRLYDQLGALVHQESVLPSSESQVSLSLSALSSGIYLMHIEQGDRSEVIKMIVK